MNEDDITHDQFVRITGYLRKERYIVWSYVLDINSTNELPFTPYRAVDWLWDMVYDNDNGDLR